MCLELVVSKIITLLISLQTLTSISSLTLFFSFHLSDLSIFWLHLFSFVFYTEHLFDAFNLQSFWKHYLINLVHILTKSFLIRFFYFYTWGNIRQVKWLTKRITRSMLQPLLKLLCSMTLPLHLLFGIFFLVVSAIMYLFDIVCFTYSYFNLSQGRVDVLLLIMFSVIFPFSILSVLFFLSYPIFCVCLFVIL